MYLKKYVSSASVTSVLELNLDFCIYKTKWFKECPFSEKIVSIGMEKLLN
jgi:hypothetical protein